MTMPEPTVSVTNALKIFEDYTFIEITPGDIKALNKFANMFIAYVQEIHGVDDVPLHSWDRVNRIMRDVDDGIHRVWLIVENTSSDIVGFAGLSERGELSPAWVHPDHRGRGLQKRATDLRIEEGGWFTSVRIGNVASEKNITSRGFVLASEHGPVRRYALPDALELDL